MSIPTTGETFAKLLETVRMAEEHSAMMAHLVNAQGDSELAKSWLIISEKFKHMQNPIIKLAQGRMQ